MSAQIFKAEIEAKKACDLPEFSNVNILGIKDKVSQLASLIGSVEGLFSTYTKHDISHINAMLRMLEWVIPPKTQDTMTSVDWLLITLSIYFHDLGMLSTKKEFEDRLKNVEYNTFLHKIYNDPSAKDYIARTELMSDEEKETFFYQEYVRLNHASRIREWVLGRESYYWGDGIKKVANEIFSMTAQLPTRFRENLATVCESHHKDDLNNTNKYPLSQRYGSEKDEIANVQYAAILLRTVDLLHITKDRTPSVMYRIIDFSDLKSIKEWDKQRGTFAVGMKGRFFDEEDLDSHVVEVNADFSEEAPFFALTEYLTWADSQIKQSKQWADKSQNDANAKNFSFPWHSIKSDIRVEGNLPHQMRFELDRGRLLNLLVGHTIYNDATVAIRELIQNSIDAVRYQYYNDLKDRDKDKAVLGRIVVHWKPEERELIIEDNGTGMDLDVIQNHLLTVGSSFYNTPQFQINNENFTPISKFGIGVLTCFMVSDSIEIVTCKNGEGRRLRMTSVHADYLLKNLDFGDPQLEGLEPHGTKIKLAIRASVNVGEKPILNILNHWIGLPICDIHYYDETHLNKIKIGFDSAESLLKSLTTDNVDNLSRESYEVISIQESNSELGKCDLAFLVYKNKRLGRDFVLSDPNRLYRQYKDDALINIKNKFGVFIEGIKVDQTIPGFKGSFMGILSVRDNKSFRTTVSRSDLEQDEEYNKVASFCVDAFFSHIKKEVEIIANRKNNPLSQASTSGYWLYRTLSQYLSDKSYKHLKLLYEQIPSMVLEATNDINTNRELISVNDLKQMDHFWTVESRVSDYLGIISRDIGRELHISEYINDKINDGNIVNISPILTDADVFSIFILESHEAEHVLFSMRQQRTFIKWKKRKFPPLNPKNFIKFQKEVRDIFRQSEIGEYLFDHLGIESINNIAVAPFTGDLDNVIIINTDIVSILMENSLAGNVYNSIDHCLREKTNLEYDETISLLVMQNIFKIACISDREISRRGGAFEGYTNQLALIWQEYSDLVSNIFRKYGIGQQIDSKYHNVFGNDENTFSASKYWFDWKRQASYY